MTTIATWNCNMAFREKKSLILEYDPDILIIQECENPDSKGQWDEFTDWRWTGDNDNKGLGVFCRNGLRIKQTVPTDSLSRYSLPIQAYGDLDILGLWAMNNDQDPKRRYIGQVYTALQDYRDLVGTNCIVAGDFNWNIMWDESPNSPLVGDFMDTVDLLTESGLVSAYHRLTATKYGEENTPTFFMHKKEDRPYHTDYLFIPKTLAYKVEDFTIGSYNSWIDASDHMPLILDLAD